MYTVQYSLEPELADQLEDYFCEWEHSPWSLVRPLTHEKYTLWGYFLNEEEARKCWARLSAQYEVLPKHVECYFLQDHNWKEAYKKHLKHWKICDFHWVPIWDREKVKIPPEERAIYIDSGMAFGTGSHESTRLCAKRLFDFRLRYPERWKRSTVVDAGCGSGILSITAAACGFGSVLGFDIDPEAIRVSNENCEMNGMEERIVFIQADLEKGLKIKPRADLILANLQADLHCKYAKNFLEALGVGSMLAMSGILADEVEKIKAKFEMELRKQSVTFESESRVLGEWADLCYMMIQ